MPEKTTHNLRDADRTLVVQAATLPMAITLQLADGSTKKYVLSYAPKAEGLILNKAI